MGLWFSEDKEIAHNLWHRCRPSKRNPLPISSVWRHAYWSVEFDNICLRRLIFLFCDHANYFIKIGIEYLVRRASRILLRREFIFEHDRILTKSAGKLVVGLRTETHWRFFWRTTSTVGEISDKVTGFDAASAKHRRCRQKIAKLESWLPASLKTNPFWQRNLIGKNALKPSPGLHRLWTRFCTWWHGFAYTTLFIALTYINVMYKTQLLLFDYINVH